MSSNSSEWKAFDASELIERRQEEGVPYLEFLRVPDLSCGIYFLPAGSTDMQSPHDEDEVYYVMHGRARIRVEGEERVVGPGSVLYIRASSDHSFVEIEEDTTFMVFFASGGPSSDA